MLLRYPPEGMGEAWGRMLFVLDNDAPGAAICRTHRLYPLDLNGLSEFPRRPCFKACDGMKTGTGCGTFWRFGPGACSAVFVMDTLVLGDAQAGAVANPATWLFP